MRQIEVFTNTYRTGTYAVQKMATGSQLHYLGDQGYSFVNEVDEEFICPICSKLLLEPHLTECCGKHFCRLCLVRWLDTNFSKTCPQCRTESFTHMLDKSVERKITELHVLCTNSSHGCDWTGSLYDLQQHLKSCTYNTILCPNGCGEYILQSDIENHKKSQCRLRQVQCELCSTTCTFELLTKEHWLVCPKLSAECNHQRVGSDQLQHSCYNKSHAVTDRNLFQRLFHEMAEMKQDIITLQQEREELKTELTTANQKLRDVSIAMNTLASENSNIRRTLLRELEFLHHCSKAPECLAMDCMQTQLGHRDIHLKPFGGALTFRFSQYSRYKSKQTGKVWQSPSFFIADSYLFCITVHPNGQGAGQGTHTSLSLHLLRGRHDPELKWPLFLNAELEIRLMNQLDIASSSPRRRLVSVASRSLDSSPADSTRKRHPTLSRRQTTDHTQVHTKETLRISSKLAPVNDSSDKLSPPVATLELFCLSSTMESVVYKDSIVLQVCLNL